MSDGSTDRFLDMIVREEDVLFAVRINF